MSAEGSHVRRVMMGQAAPGLYCGDAEEGCQCEIKVLQWSVHGFAVGCSTTTDPLLSQRFPTDILVPIHVPCNVCVSL